ncbi:hypothetical protein Trydic_g11511 [Trypoxylus dichotomus]
MRYDEVMKPNVANIPTTIQRETEPACKPQRTLYTVYSLCMSSDEVVKGQKRMLAITAAITTATVKREPTARTCENYEYSSYEVICNESKSRL